MKPGRRTLVAAAIAIAVAFGSGGLAIAQSIVTAASLSGRVEDPSGAVVSATRITVTRIDTGQSWTAESGDDGQYHLLALPPGDYRIDAKHDGFEPLTLAATSRRGAAARCPGQAAPAERDGIGVGSSRFPCRGHGAHPDGRDRVAGGD